MYNHALNFFLAWLFTFSCIAALVQHTCSCIYLCTSYVVSVISMRISCYIDPVGGAGSSNELNSMIACLIYSKNVA